MIMQGTALAGAVTAIQAIYNAICILVLNAPETPLHWAAEDGQLQTVEYLIVPSVQQTLGSANETPLDLARNNGHTNVVKYLESFVWSAYYYVIFDYWLLCTSQIYWFYTILSQGCVQELAQEGAWHVRNFCDHAPFYRPCPSIYATAPIFVVCTIKNELTFIADGLQDHAETTW